jgi:hypothetical protein
MFNFFNLYKFSALKPSLIFLQANISPIKMDTYAIVGQTFSIKEKIKALGFSWSGNLQISVDGEDISGGWIQSTSRVSSLDDLKNKLSSISVDVNSLNSHKVELLSLSNQGMTGFFDASSNSTVISGDTRSIKDSLSSMGFGFKKTIYSGPDNKKYSPVWAKRFKLNSEELEKLKSLGVNFINDVIEEKNDNEDVKKASHIRNEIISNNTTSGISSMIDSFVSEISEKIFSKDTDAKIEALKKFLNFQASFNHFSFNNQILMYLQDPEATEVATSSQWEADFGRKIKPGAIPVVLIRPVGTVIKLTDKEKAALRAQGVPEPVIKRKDNRVINVSRFTDYVVYDVRFTDPIPGKEHYDPSEKEQIYGKNDTSEYVDKITEAVIEVAEKDYKLKVNFSGQGKSMGVSHSDGNININENSSGVRALSTIIHEMTHEIVHTQEYRKKRDLKTYAAGEIQAEGISYMVLKYFKIPFDFEQSCILYMRMWSKMEKEEVTNSLKSVRNEANEIIEKIKIRISNQGI